MSKNVNKRQGRIIDVDAICNNCGTFFDACCSWSKTVKIGDEDWIIFHCPKCGTPFRNRVKI